MPASSSPDRVPGGLDELSRRKEGSRMDDGLVIETRELAKRYGERIVAVDNL